MHLKTVVETGEGRGLEEEGTQPQCDSRDWLGPLETFNHFFIKNSFVISFQKIPTQIELLK